jgi:peroxiredoxin
VGKRHSVFEGGKMTEEIGIWVRKFLLVILALPLVLGCGGKRDDEKGGTGAKAPGFVLENLKGGTLRLGDLRGKVVLLNFFATWCGPCREEIPELVKLHKRFKDRGLEIVGISLDMEGAAVLAPFKKRYMISYPIVLGTRQTVLDYGGIKGIPTSFLIDRKGMIIERFVGWRPAEVIEAAVVKALDSQPARAQHF